MSYKALITPVVNVRDHPNADRLNLGTCSGFQVVLSKDIEEGTLGVFFGCDGKLSDEMLKMNNLFRHDYLNHDPEAKAGFFDDNGRVRVQKFKGENSDGFWCPLRHLEWTGVPLSTLLKGDKVDVLCGHRICEKYYTPATERAMIGRQGKQSTKGPKLKDLYPTFREHYDTSKLRNSIGTIPNDQRAIVYITEKCHGCVDKHTLVETLEHGLVTIGTVVDKKLEAHVKSLNTVTNEIEYAKIEDWYFYPNDEDWYEIELDDGRKIQITGNNPIWLSDLNCYRRVDELDGTEKLLIDI